MGSATLLDNDFYEFRLVNGKLPADSLVKPHIYSIALDRIETNLDQYLAEVIPATYIRISGDRCDLATLKPLSDAEIQSARAPEPEPEPVPAAPQFSRTSRQPGDSASRLGVTVGRGDSDVRLGNKWCWHAWNLPYAAVIGAVRANVTTAYASDRLPLLIFDSFGTKVLDTRLSAIGGGYIGAKLDQIVLPAGDYLVVWHGMSLAGFGSFQNEHTGCLQNLPKHPILDELLQAPPVVEGLNSQPIPVGVPQIKFSAE